MRSCFTVIAPGSDVSLSIPSRWSARAKRHVGPCDPFLVSVRVPALDDACVLGHQDADFLRIEDAWGDGTVLKRLDRARRLWVDPNAIPTAGA
jgi:hypothetical protein